MGDMRIGEAIGFTEWLRLVREPDITQSISLDLDELPTEIYENVFDVLGLPLDLGMYEDKLESLIGTAVEEESYADDRKSLVYLVRMDEKFYISSTIKHEGGLIYFVIMNHHKTIVELTAS